MLLSINHMIDNMKQLDPHIQRFSKVVVEIVE